MSRGNTEANITPPGELFCKMRTYRIHNNTVVCKDESQYCKCTILGRHLHYERIAQ